MRGIPRYTLVWGACYTLGARYLSKNTVHYYFVLTSCPCNWATRLFLFNELSKAGHLSGTKANLLDVKTVQMLRDELTCKKEIKIVTKLKKYYNT